MYCDKGCPAFSALTNDCHAESPKGFPMPGERGGLQVISIWPPVRPGQWCMRHPARKWEVVADAEIVEEKTSGGPSSDGGGDAKAGPRLVQ